MFAATPAFGQAPAGKNKPIWLVGTRPTFVEDLKPLVAMRRKEGFQTIVSTQPVRKTLARLTRRPAFLLLVGDYRAGAAMKPWYVAGRRRRLYRWRASQKEQFASDALWGDIDTDLIPDIAVGRIPVRTTEQLRVVVSKIITFESKPLTADDLGLPIWAASPAYNSVIDGMATWMLVNTVLREAPGWAGVWAMSSDPAHPLCGWPPDQNRMFTKQLQRGDMLAILMGHGTRENFYSMSFNGKAIYYCARDAEATLSVGTPGCAAVILACKSGDFGGPTNCLAESLLLTPGAPVAVIGATTESHPLTNYFSGLSLLRKCRQTDKRLGSIWLTAQRKAMETRDLIMERLLANVEGKLEDKINVLKLRRDQILMYALLGDPATRLAIPNKLAARIERVEAGWEWQVDKPNDASRLYVSLRPAALNFPTVELPLAEDATRKRFKQASAVFEFEPLGELSPDEDWKGVINSEGTLRFVAPANRYISAVTFDIKSPDTQPPGKAGRTGSLSE